MYRSPERRSPLGRAHAAFPVVPARAAALIEVLSPMRTLPAPPGWSDTDDPPLPLVSDGLAGLLARWDEASGRDPWADLWRAVLAARVSTEDLGLGEIPEPMAAVLVGSAVWSLEGHRKRLLTWTPAIHPPGTAGTLLDALSRLEADPTLDEAWTWLVEDVVASELDELRAGDAERDRAFRTDRLQARLDEAWASTWLRMQRWAERIRGEPDAAWLQIVS